MTALTAGLVLSLLSAAPAKAPERPRLYAGIFLSDVSGFDLREGRFQADLDVWVKWSGGTEPPQLRFVNGELSQREELERQSDGDWHSVRWRVQGTFRGTFPLQAFPFDRQALRIQLAAADGDVHLLPDLGSSGMARQFSITGWEYEPFFRSEVGRERVASDLGSIKNEGRARTLDSVAFVVDLHRPRTSNILKFMLPLAIILAMAFLVFVLPAAELEVRSAMGVTSLLSVVAFHFAMSGSLPDVPYLVAADRLFLASYVLVLASIFETVLVFRLGDARLRAGVAVDRASLALLPLAAILVGASVAFPRPPPVPPSEPRPAPAPAVSARDELRVAVVGLNTLNIQSLNQLLRRGLTEVGPDGALRPHLAEAVPSMTDESVRLLPDGGMLVRWRLKEGLRWSDGAPLTVGDLVYSLGLVANADRSAVTAVDARTLEIRYERRLADALTDFPIFPEHAARAISNDGGIEAVRLRNQTAPVPGDGPYRLAAFTPGKEALFERNPYFAGAPPAIARIRVVVRGPEQMVAQLASGELDFLPMVPTTAIDPLRAQPQTVVRATPDDALLYLQPDLHVPQLADPRVRRALLMALDRPALAHVYAPGARPALTYRPDDAAEFAKDAEQTPYAPKEAAKLLAAAGGPKELPLTLVETTAGSGYAQVADAVTRELAEVGVKVSPTVLPTNKALEAHNKASHGGLLLYFRKDRRQARFFNLPTLPGATLDVRTPRPHFPAPLVETYALLESSLFPERQRLLSQQLQRSFAQSLPLLPLAFGTQVSAHGKALHGFDPGQSGSLWLNVESWTLDAPAK